jgi:heat shock protein HslJ
MKKVFLWLLILLLVLSLAACEQLGSVDQARPKTIYVASQMVDCEAQSPRTCFLVKENPDEQWRVWNDAIDGFQFEPGFEYELIVSESEIDDPTSAGTAVSWSLTEIVEKVPVPKGVVEATAETSVAGQSESSIEVDESPEPPAELIFVPIQVDKMGVSTVVPADWPKIEDDPLLRDAWGPGQYQFVAFHSVNGDNVQQAMAQLLSTTVEELKSGTIDGEYWEETIGDQNWGMYAVENPNVNLTQTVSMVERDGTIYVVSLFIGTEMKDAVLIPVLEKFAIENEGVDDKVAVAEAGTIPLVNTEWVLQTYNDGTGQLVKAAPAVEITAIFSADGRLSGFAGCNEFISFYAVEDAGLTVSFPTLTRKECIDPPGVMLQETSFLGDLVITAAYEIVGTELQLLNDEGNVVLTFMPSAAD